MKDKICLVTGATSGLGRAAAFAFAGMGATLIVVGRDKEKTENLLNELRGVSGNSRIEHIIADLEQQESITRLAEEFMSRHDSLHVLINNAAGYFAKREETKDGYERTFALNHLGYFLLTNLLLDVIKKSEPARIVNVSSDAHRTIKEMNWDDLQFKKKWPLLGWNVYSQSKLANIYFTYELARRLKDTEVTANCIHPGFVRSGLAKNNGWYAKIIVSLLAIAAKTPEKAAETVVWAANSKEMEGVSGKYLRRLQIVSSSDISYDEEAAGRLWSTSCELTGVTV